MDLPRNERLQELELQHLIETSKNLDQTLSVNVVQKNFVQCAVIIF